MSIWFETRGLKDGEWFMLFCSDSERQERESTRYAIQNWDDPEFEGWEDIRMFHPDTAPSIPRHVGHSERSYMEQWHKRWEAKVGRRNVRSLQDEQEAAA